MNITFLINFLLPELLCKATHWQWTSPGKSHLQTGHPKQLSHSKKAGPTPSVAPIMERVPCRDARGCSVLEFWFTVNLKKHPSWCSSACPPSCIPGWDAGCVLRFTSSLGRSFACSLDPSALQFRSDDSHGNYCPSKLPSSELGRRPCRTCLFRTHHFAPPLTVTWVTASVPLGWENIFKHNNLVPFFPPF